MTDSNMELTRRKILAGMGGVGAAGAAAGLGTSALFSDEESFENNSLVAGELDLKVDWEEHYSYPQLYGFGDPAAELDVTRSEPDDTTDYVGLPDPTDPVVWVHEDDLGQYMSNTAIDAFPDPDNDGEQEIDLGDDFSYAPCEDGADLPDDLDNLHSGEDANEGAVRTRNSGTIDEPLISLEDVKPGDFGEFTFSFHLCDNPGYVWLQAANVDSNENGFEEPEPEEGDPDGDGELAENIKTVWWYDDGDNVLEEEEIGKVDVMLAVDTSGSLSSDDVSDLETSANSLATELDDVGNARVGGLSFGGGSIHSFTGLSGSPVSFSGLSPEGNTPTPAALEIAAAELDNNARSDAETFIVLFTDGGPNWDPEATYSAGGYTVGPFTGGATSPSATVSNSELEETADIAGDIRTDHTILTVGINDDRKPSGREGDDATNIFGTGSNGYLSTYLQNEIAGGMSNYFQAEDPATVSDLEGAIVAAIAMSEEVFRRGTLADDLSLLESSLQLDGDLSTEENACFQDGMTHYIGFGWWVPENVGNEIQGDSVSFDLGFYTEQCRNNPTPDGP